MQRLLTPSLQRRCQHIRYICLRKQGQQHPDQKLPGTLSHDNEIYDEWVAFIRIVQPHILVIAHGGDIHPPWSGVKTWSWVHPPLQLQWPEIAPMDEKFRETLLPLLREGWPGLERIATRGGNVLEDLEDMECVIVDVDERVESCWNATVREEG